jgi:hypothetical protein
MKINYFCTLFIGLLVFCFNLTADTITLAGLPDGDTDTLSIQLDPLDGAVSGLPGATVGWGFTITWTSTDGDWISFNEATLGSETNPALLTNYSDFIQQQGGSQDYGLPPSTWSETFDGVTQGVGAYTISNDPTVAVPGAEDSGQITFNFDVLSGDPLDPDTIQIGNSNGYFYSGNSTDFSVTVLAPESTPEPSTLGLALASVGLAVVLRRKSIRNGTRIVR